MLRERATVSRQVNGHSERRFCNGMCECRTRRQDMDAIGKTVFVVNVVGEIGLDIDDRFELSGAL